MTQASNLDVPDIEPCAFCQYLNGERPYTILEKGPNVALLVTREQRGVGHVLVIPVAHRETILDLAEDESHDLMQGVRRASRAIDRGYRRPGIAIWQNNGIAAHQTIPHMHFHVAGTLPSGGTDFGPVPEQTIEATDVIATVLRDALRS